MLEHFLGFDKLIGTKLIKILYYIGLVSIVGGAVFAAFGGLQEAGIGGFFSVLIAAAFILLFWRFMCEIYMLFFRMSDDLRDIKNHQLGREANKVDVDIDL